MFGFLLSNNEPIKFNYEINCLIKKCNWARNWIFNLWKVFIGKSRINFLQVVIIFLCSIILFIRVMYCKHDTQADIESKRRIISEKIEMKRNSANMKRSSSILPNAKSEKVYKSSSDVNNSEQKKEKYPLNSISEGDGPKPVRPNCLNDMKLKTDTIDSK